MTATRSDIANEVALQEGISQRSAQAVLTAALKAIRTHLERGDEVAFRDFGSFRFVQCKARRRQDPNDKDAVLVIAAHRRVKFVAVMGIIEKVASA